MSAEKRKYYIQSFGCQMNDVDLEVMERLLERERGKQIFPEREDVIIFRKNN